MIRLRYAILAVLAGFLAFAYNNVSLGQDDDEQKWAITDKTKTPKERHRATSFALAGKLDRTSPFVALDGSNIKEAVNMRRPAPGLPVGWKARGGCTPYNTTAIASAEVKGLAQLIVTETGVEKFYAQCNDDFYVSSGTPPDTVTTFGTKLLDLASDAGPMHWGKIDDEITCAASGQTPWATSGGSTYPDSFLTQHTTGTTAYNDGSMLVADELDTTSIGMPNHSGTSEYAYLGFHRRLDGAELQLIAGTTNIMAAKTGVSAYTSSGWTSCTNIVDGTADGSGVTTLYESGYIAWTNPANMIPYVLPGTKNHLFWYRFRVTADVTDNVQVKRILVADICEEVTHLWSGLYEIVLGALESHTTGFYDWTPEVTDGSDVEYMDADITNSQAIYLGFAQPVMGFFMEITSDSGNVGTATGWRVYYWDGDESDWSEITGVTNDSTGEGYPLQHTGVMQWDTNGIRPDRRQLAGRLTPFYWYKWEPIVSLASETISLYEIGGIVDPNGVRDISKYEGVMHYNGRAMYWPGQDYKNGMDYSQEYEPQIINGPKAGSTGGIFGPGRVHLALEYSSYGIVFTKDPYRTYVLQGKVPGEFDELCISTKVGAIGPHAACVVEDGIQAFAKTRIVHAVFFVAQDGLYLTDGMTVTKISQPISDYWDTGATPYIQPEYAYKCYVWYNFIDKTVHIGAPVNFENDDTPQTTCNVELIYSPIGEEFYDRYVRNSPAACGLSLIGNDDQRLTYIGDYSGTVHRLDTGKNDNNNVITHHIKTADFNPLEGKLEDALNHKFKLRAVKIKAKAQTVGVAEILVYPDDADSGVTPPGGTISLVNSGYKLAQGRTLMGRDITYLMETNSIRFRSGVSTAELDTVMELYGYTVDYYEVRPTH